MKPLKRYFVKKEFTALLLTAVLIVFSILNLFISLPALREALSDNQAGALGLPGQIAALEKTVNENILGRYGFIEGYGALNLILGKHEENNFEVVKDNEGVLHNTYFTDRVNGEINDVLESVQILHDLSLRAGSRFLVAMPPDKFLGGITDMDSGYPYNFCNENIDYYLENLAQRGIDHVDLRLPYENLDWDLNQLFYRTDHHWTTVGAFQIYCYLVNWMEKTYGISLDPGGFYTEEDNYNFIPYERRYLGSQGRKAGVIYSGIEDFTLVYPKFETRFQLDIAEYDISHTDRMEGGLIDLSVLNRDKTIYERDFYGMYYYGTLYGMSTVTNLLNASGPRVLVIRDSYACAPMTYFSSLCSSIDLLYPPYYSGSIREQIENGDYDFVMLLVYPGNFSRSFYSFDLE